MNPISELNTVVSLLGAKGNAVGWTNTGSLSPHLFATITDTESMDMVTGRIKSYSVSNENTWENVFEGMDADSMNPYLSGVIQSGDLSKTVGWESLQALQGKTLVTEAQSLQIWRGIQPQSISLELEFKAFHDAYKEVELPIQYLTKMQAPSLSQNKVAMLEEAKDKALEKLGLKTKEEAEALLGKRDGILGDVPSFVTVDFLGKRFSVDYVIESISEDIDIVRVDANGNRVKQVVNITLGSRSGVVKDRVRMNNLSSVLKQFNTVRHELKSIF